MEPLAGKLQQFGWEAYECDGHNFDSMHKTFQSVKGSKTDSPKFVIVKTLRGKGLPSIEGDATRWFVNFTGEEVELLLKELHSGIKSKLTSEKIIAR